MESRRLLLLKMMLCAGSLAVSSQAQGQWTTVSVPGADVTSVYDIDGERIVGEYHSTADGNYHGFVYDGVDLVTLDAFGEPWDTLIMGIDGDRLVGGHGTHGFLYDGVTWTSIDKPGAISTYVYGIEGDTLVGTYSAGSNPRGFVYDGSDWADVDARGATHTYVTDIDGGRIAGYFFDSAGTHGFIYDGMDWGILDMPGAKYTRVYGINGNNVVGRYTIGDSDVHGFLFDGTDWTTLDMPEATRTYAMGVSGDRVVGYADTAEEPWRQSFIYVIPEPSGVLLLGLGWVWHRRQRRP